MSGEDVNYTYIVQLQSELKNIREDVQQADQTLQTISGQLSTAGSGLSVLKWLTGLLVILGVVINVWIMLKIERLEFRTITLEVEHARLRLDGRSNGK